MTFSIASSPEEFAERIQRRPRKWGKVIKASRIEGGL